MLLIGYLYGIKSERRLELVEEVSLNLAYRWFSGIELIIEYRIAQLLVRIEEDVFGRLTYSE